MVWEDEEFEEIGERKTLKDWIVENFWIIIAVVAVLFLRGRLGTVTYDKAVIYTFFFVIFILFAKATYTSFKNATPKLVFNGGFSTTDGSFETVGNFALIKPAVKAYQWYFKLNGLYVCPLDSITKVGPNIVSTCAMEQVSLDEMPEEVRTWIIKNYVRPPYYLGYADPEQFYTEVDDEAKLSGLARPKVAYLIDELKKQNKQIALRDKILEGDLKVIESFVSASGRITSRAKGGIAGLLDKVLTKKEE